LKIVDIGVLAELREFCARPAQQWGTLKASLHPQLELFAPERPYQFKEYRGLSSVRIRPKRNSGAH